MISEKLFLEFLSRVTILEEKVSHLEKELAKKEASIPSFSATENPANENVSSDGTFKAPSKNEIIRGIANILPSDITVTKNKQNIGGLTLTKKTASGDLITHLVDLRMSKDYSTPGDGFQWSSWHRINKDDLKKGTPKDFYIFSIALNKNGASSLQFLIFDSETIKIMTDNRGTDSANNYHFGFHLDDKGILTDKRYAIDEDSKIQEDKMASVNLKDHLNNWDIILNAFN